MRAPRPPDFGFLAGGSLVFALLMAGLLADAVPTDELLSSRMFAGVAGALALLTAEALWFVRPWAFRASLAFAGMLVVFVFALVGSSRDGLGLAAFALMFIGVSLRAVHRGLRAGPTIRIPAPRP